MSDWLDVSDTTPRIAYTATLNQTAFTVPFVFFDETDLQVYVNDELQTLSTDYVTSGVMDEDGGTVTFNTGLAASDSVVIARVLAYELTTHIPTAGDLDVAAMNLQNSRLVAMLQQAVEDLPRSVRQPTSDADALSVLPAAATRASKILAFDADGDVTVLAAVTAAAAATAFWVTVLSTADDAAESRSLLGITDQAAAVGAVSHMFFD